MSIIVASGLEDAKRQARAAIETEQLDAIRIWADGRQTIEVKRPARQVRPATPAPAIDRGARMAAMKAQGATHRAIGDEFGISKHRVRDVIVSAQARATRRAEQPNLSALSVRAQNALKLIVEEPEDDAGERDRQLPGRVATLTRRELMKVPNLGKGTIAELEVWLWERGLCFDG